MNAKQLSEIMFLQNLILRELAADKDLGGARNEKNGQQSD
jgi:hypothetical protein